MRLLLNFSTDLFHYNNSAAHRIDYTSLENDLIAFCVLDQMCVPQLKRCLHGISFKPVSELKFYVNTIVVSFTRNEKCILNYCQAIT
jgi:hypothetical protein